MRHPPAPVSCPQPRVCPSSPCHEFFSLLHPPADFRRRAFGADLPDRPDRDVQAADLGIPRGRAAPDRRARRLSGRKPEDDLGDSLRAAGAAAQRRGELTLHLLPGDQRRRDDAHGHLQAGYRHRQGAGARPEPRLPGVAQAARGSPPSGRAHHQVVPRPHDGGPPHERWTLR